MAQGWECWTAYGRCANSSETKLIRIGGTLDTYMHYGQQRVLDNEGLNSRWATMRFIEEVDLLTAACGRVSDIAR